MDKFTEAKRRIPRMWAAALLPLPGWLIGLPGFLAEYVMHTPGGSLIGFSVTFSTGWLALLCCAFLLHEWGMYFRDAEVHETFRKRMLPVVLLGFLHGLILLLCFGFFVVRATMVN